MQDESTAGLALPLSWTAGGTLAFLREPAHIEQAILLILGTQPGERVMRPDYGCRLGELVFAPINAATLGKAQHFVRNAIERFEPRVQIARVEAFPSPANPTTIEIHVDYTLRDMDEAQPRRLEFEFATLPPE